MENMETLRLETLKLGANAFTDHNFIRMESAEADCAVYRLDIRPESRNPFGMVHGGALYTLADDAAGGVVRQGVQRPAVDHAEGIPALRPDIQAVDRAVRLRGFHPDEIVVRKGVGPQLQCLQPERFHILHKEASRSSGEKQRQYTTAPSPFQLF